MTPAILTLASLAWLTALCCGVPAPVTGPSAKNGFLRITMPGVAYYGDPVVRAAVYAQERAELVIKWLVTLLVGNTAAWLTGGSWEAVTMFLAFGALAYGLQRSRPVIRLREYVGHAVEVLWVERHSGPRQPGYRLAEIGRMQRGYRDLFAGRDIAAGLLRAEPIARVMLVLIRPALRRFEVMS